MSTLYPTSVDTSTELPNPTGSNTLNSPDHASLHSNENGAITALETKLGTGSSTASAGRLLRGTGSGATAYGQLVMSTDVAAFTSADIRGVVSDETGSGLLVFATSPTLTTPTISSPTISGTITGSGIISATNAAAGFVVQVVGTTFSSVATGTTTIPLDDTIPQITEGTEFMTQAITPKASANLLIVQVTACMSHSAGNHLIGALFQDATANALAANVFYQPTATGEIVLSLTYTMTAGTTSSTTFRVRLGSPTAGTTTFNGASGSRVFGAIPKSAITITEVKV